MTLFFEIVNNRETDCFAYLLSNLISGLFWWGKLISQPEECEFDLCKGYFMKELAFIAQISKIFSRLPKYRKILEKNSFHIWPMAKFG
jgi:hypothetical protein